MNRPQLEPGVFFDEVRSDRGRVMWLFIPACALIAVIMLWLLLGGTKSLLARSSWNGWIAVIFGCPGVPLFGFALISMIRRTFKPPIQVRIDRQGVVFGDERTAWKDVEEIAAVSGWAIFGLSVLIRTRGSRWKFARLIPGKMPLAQWYKLSAELRDFFRAAGIQTVIKDSI